MFHDWATDMLCDVGFEAVLALALPTSYLHMTENISPPSLKKKTYNNYFMYLSATKVAWIG